MNNQAASAQNPLAQLNDIQVPETVSAWPLAWGWWVLIVAVTMMLIVLARWVYKRYRANDARRQAITLVQQVSPDHNNWPSQLNSILKRTALHYCNSEQVAPLYGKRWLTFLQSLVPDSSRGNTDALATMLKAQYASSVADVAKFDACQKACIAWLKKARFSEQVPLSNQEVAHV